MAEDARASTETPPPAEPDRSRIRASDYIQPDFRVAQGALPVLVFVAVNYAGPAQLAIVASFITAVYVFVQNRSRGVIRVLSVLGFSIIAVSAGAGLALDSDKAFVAQNIVADFVFVVVSIGSVVIGKPLLGAIARELTPGIQPVMPIGHFVFVRLTLINAVLNLLTGVLRIFMIDALSANQYAILSRVVFMPLSIGFVLFCYWWITRHAIRIWPADVPFEHMRRRPRPTEEAEPP